MMQSWEKGNVDKINIYYDTLKPCSMWKSMWWSNESILWCNKAMLDGKRVCYDTKKVCYDAKRLS